MIKTLMIAATVSTPLAFMAIPAASVIGVDATQAAACTWTKKKPCGYNPDPGVRYSGNGHPTNMVKATVCYSEWNDLANGSRGKWWGPTLRRGSWHADRDAVYKPCYVQWVVKGTRIESDSACTPGKVLVTQKIFAAGTYNLM